MKMVVELVCGFVIVALAGYTFLISVRLDEVHDEKAAIEQQFEQTVKMAKEDTEKEFKRGAVHAHKGLIKCALVKQLTKPAEWQCIDNNGKGY